MNSFNRRFIGPINIYYKYGDARCMNDYTSYKRDIEQQIDNLDKKSNANFYQEWEKLKKYITEKDNALYECYKNRHIKIPLIKDDKIKNFMNKCSKKSQCNNRSRQAQRPALINPVTKGSCKRPNDCKEPAARKEAKPKNNPTAAVVASKAISSSIQNPNDQGKSHVAVPGSSKGSVNLQTQTNIGHSVVADTKAPELKDNTHSETARQTETQKQSASAPDLKKEKVLDPYPSKASSQVISEGEYPSIDTFPLKVLETNKHPGDPHGSKDLRDKALDEHTTGVESVEVQKLGDKDCAENSSAEELPEGTPGIGAHGDEQSIIIVTNRVGTDMTSVRPRDSVTINVDTVISGPGLPVIVPAGNIDADPLTPGCEKSRRADCPSKDPGIKPTEAENLDRSDAVENPHSEVTQEQKEDLESEDEELKQSEQQEPGQHDKFGEGNQLHLRTSQNQGGSYLAPKGLTVSHESNSAESTYPNGNYSERNTAGEYNDSNAALGTQHGTFKRNNDESGTPIDDDLIKKIKSYIIMTLIPLAIFLLLTLLIKYTPLGMLFTKKRRKRRKQMNEKLQRVLVESSNAREERSIQFAYSAFEYSK